MGQWNITIRGTGSHHNKRNAKDADRMAAEFVRQLKHAGHVVTGASITCGTDNDLSNPEKYLDDRDAIDSLG